MERNLQKTYIKKFNASYEQTTSKFGQELNPPLITHDSLSQYDSNIIHELKKDFFDGVISSPEGLIGKSFHMVRDASYVLFEMGIDHVITIGNVSFDNTPYFSTSIESINNEIKEGFVKEKTANAHAWLTLDTGQILDLTILQSSNHKYKLDSLSFEDSIYLSGVSANPNILHEPLLTGFVYHFKVVLSPDNTMPNIYSEWFKHLYEYKQLIAEKRYV